MGAKRLGTEEQESDFLSKRNNERYFVGGWVCKILQTKFENPQPENPQRQRTRAELRHYEGSEVFSELDAVPKVVARPGYVCVVRSGTKTLTHNAQRMIQSGHNLVQSGQCS